MDKAEERLKKHIEREGQVKTQITVSVSEFLALMLQKEKTVKETWDALDAEIKILKIVVKFLKKQFHNIKCSEDDDLRVHLDTNTHSSMIWEPQLSNLSSLIASSSLCYPPMNL